MHGGEKLRGESHEAISLSSAPYTVSLISQSCQNPNSGNDTTLPFQRSTNFRHARVPRLVLYETSLGLVHTSDGSDGSGVVSEVGIGRKFWSSVNRHDGSDGSRSGIGRKRNSSDPSDSDSVELPTPLTIPIFDLHWIVTLLPLPIPTPLPIP